MTKRIQLYSKKGECNGFTLVDDIDFDYLNQWTWRRAFGTRTSYVKRMKRKGNSFLNIFMHRVVMRAYLHDYDFPEWMPISKWLEIDHKNHLGLDNRRQNLRVVTHRQNGQNKRSALGATSRFLGVWKQHRFWKSAVTLGGSRIFLGNFLDEEEAGVAYVLAKEAYIAEHGF